MISKSILPILILFPLFSFARDVQQSECVGPAGAPVKAIYLHGWFPPKGSGNYVKLEQSNRRQLEQLAQRLGIRIAIPLAPNINSDNGNREWPGGMGNSANNSLRAMEGESKRVCGAPLAPQRTLIGFSNGGFAARNIALSCDDHLKKNYASVVMMGAKAWANPPDRNFAGCPKLTAMRGEADDSTDTCVKGRGCQGFKSVATQMRKGLGGNVDIETYRGGHVLAPNERLAALIQSVPASPNLPAPVQPPVVVKAPTQPPLTGDGFMFTIPEATK